MSYWSSAPQPRDQLVLFATRLEDALAADHSVRLLDEILGRLDWSRWEAAYDGKRGQPPIHPRIVAAVILYGLLKRIRSSRSLEEALLVRMDFRWLAEGRTIDHTTLSEFRRRHAQALKQLFVQTGLVARQLGWAPLEQLAFDGTRLRANSRRSGSRTPQQLREMQRVLSEKFAALEQRLVAADRDEDEVLGESCLALPAELADTRRRLAQVDAALAELKRVEEANETLPSRLPLTDPEARVTPNKEGGFAPNYTPLATVDTAAGLIVAADVIAMTDEEHALVAQLEQVQEDFGLSLPPPELLGDGKMSSGANLQALAELKVTLYSPAPTRDPQRNPALRDDPTQPVPADAWDRLPTTQRTRGGKKSSQLDKAAFVYDSPRDCYWCPAGRRLSPEQRTSEACGRGVLKRTRYKAAATACADCPLKSRCLQSPAPRREISRYEHDHLAEELAERMATPEAQAKYARRSQVAERPFAVIKQQFGARNFLLRGLEQVKIEWHWLATAFNLERLMSLIRNRDGPRTEPLASFTPSCNP